MCSNIFPFFFSNASNTSNINWDIIESDSNIQIVAELPGYEQEQISITYQNNILTLRAEKTETPLPVGSIYLAKENHREISQRNYRVPLKVNAVAIYAEYKNGIINITLPYTSLENPQRINIGQIEQKVAPVIKDH